MKVSLHLWFLSPISRKGAAGQVFAGFGLFFMAIETFKHACETIAASFNLAMVFEFEVLGVILLVGIGFLLTFSPNHLGACPRLD